MDPNPFSFVPSSIGPLFLPHKAKQNKTKIPQKTAKGAGTQKIALVQCPFSNDSICSQFFFVKWNL
jgi:hypothetical protein